MAEHTSFVSHTQNKNPSSTLKHHKHA